MRPFQICPQTIFFLNKMAPASSRSKISGWWDRVLYPLAGGRRRVARRLLVGGGGRRDFLLRISPATATRRQRAEPRGGSGAMGSSPPTPPINSAPCGFFLPTSHTTCAHTRARRSALPGGCLFFLSYLLEVWGRLARGWPAAPIALPRCLGSLASRIENCRGRRRAAALLSTRSERRRCRSLSERRRCGSLSGCGACWCDCGWSLLQRNPSRFLPGYFNPGNVRNGSMLTFSTASGHSATAGTSAVGPFWCA